MDEGTEAVHVAYGQSTAQTLREALPLLGCTDRVVGLRDGLGVGPIASLDPHLRQDWGKSVLRADPMLRDALIDDPAAVEAAWSAATKPGIQPVFWACLASPSEHACFLAFAARMQGRPFDIVDATGLDVTTADGVQRLVSLGAMRVREIVASGLYAARRPIPPERHRAASEAWARLVREDAPFRVVRDGCLVSAPLTHYDARLLQQASHDWEVAAQLIGRVVGTFADPLGGDGTSDVVLLGRMLALGEDNLLDVVGPGPGLRGYHVRRPAG